MLELEKSHLIVFEIKMTRANNKLDTSSSLASSDDDGAVCYLCLDGGVDDNAGQPLRRDCSCRGTDAGLSTSNA